MSDKIARLGIERDNDMMYYIKNGDVWATPRKQKGQPKGKAQKIAPIGLELDYSKYIYYLDGDGDVARKARALGGGRKAKAPRAAKGPKVPTKVKAPKPLKARNGANGATTTRKSARSAITGHFVTEATRERHPKTTVEDTYEVPTGRKKTPEELDREIEECLAKAGLQHH